MPYCTRQDLIDRGLERELIERTGGNVTGMIDDTVLDKAITDAASTIDSMATTRPITPITPLLTKTACDITRYYLYGDRDVPPYVQSAYDEAMRHLLRVREGKADWGIDSTGTAPAEQIIVMSVSTPKLFERSS